METKKSILNWWLKLDQNKPVRYYKHMPVYDDMKSFKLMINPVIKIEWIYNACNDKTIVISKLTYKRWKYPLELFWSNNECIKIADF